MRYNRIGKSGLKVSEMSLGSWLTYGDDIDTQSSIEIIHTAYENGITSFDTANAYNAGAAETVLGKALKDCRRETYVVASKLYFEMGDSPYEKGLSRKSITEQVNKSLKRLDMEYMDILYFHRFDEETPLYETLRAVDDMIRQGKVLYFGVSEWSARQIVEALHISDKYLMDRMIVNQPSFNILNRYIEKEVLPVSREHGIGQIVYSPLAQGMLTGKYRKNADIPKGSRADKAQGEFLRNEYFSERNFDKVEKLVRLSEEAGIKLSQMALAWILSVEGISGLILGASKKEQLLDNLKAADIKLTSDIIEKINQISPIN